LKKNRFVFTSGGFYFIAKIKTTIRRNIYFFENLHFNF
jgi:hypothetical protein